MDFFLFLLDNTLSIYLLKGDLESRQPSWKLNWQKTIKTMMGTALANNIFAKVKREKPFGNFHCKGSLIRSSGNFFIYIIRKYKVCVYGDFYYLQGARNWATSWAQAYCFPRISRKRSNFPHQMLRIRVWRETENLHISVGKYIYVYIYIYRISNWQEVTYLCLFSVQTALNVYVLLRFLLFSVWLLLCGSTFPFFWYKEIKEIEIVYVTSQIHQSIAKRISKPRREALSFPIYFTTPRGNVLGSHIIIKS